MFSLNVLLPTFQRAMTIKEESIIVTLFCETKIFIYMWYIRRHR